MFDKKLAIILFSVSSIAIGFLVYAFINFKQEEIRSNTPDWLKVQIFEYEKKFRDTLKEAMKCEDNSSDKISNIYILSFQNKTTKVALSEDSNYYCDSNIAQCISVIDKAEKCLILVQK